MNFYNCLMLVGCLSGFNLIILSLLHVMDIAKATSNQKIILIKSGLLMIGLAPIIFSVLKIFSSKTIEMIMPLKITGDSLVQLADNTLTVQGVNWSYCLFIMYMTGVFLMLFKMMLSYSSARKLLASSLPAVINGQPVFLNENISSPLSFGLPTAKIYFPAQAETIWTYREIEMSLAHEKIHLKHNDPLWKLVSLVIRDILFFVPWSYSLHKRFELEMEITCDEDTCVTTNASMMEYGDLLLTMSCIAPRNIAFTNITDSTLKRRFIAMKSKKQKRPVLTSLLSAMLLLTGTASIAMSSNINQDKSEFNILSTIYVDGKLVSKPRIVALANQKASLMMADNMTTKDKQTSMSGHSLKLELMARDMTSSDKNSAISIDYDIQYQNGGEMMHSKQQLILNPNQENVMTLSEAGHIYVIHVLASRT